MANNSPVFYSPYGHILILVSLSAIFGIGMAKYKNIDALLTGRALAGGDPPKKVPDVPIPVGNKNIGTGSFSGYDARHPLSPNHAHLEIVEITAHTPVSMNPSIYA